jgi:hypothetical protein
MSLPFVATDADDDSLTLSCEGNCGKGRFKNNRYEWLAEEADIGKNLILIATDGQDKTQHSVLIKQKGI